MALGRRLRGLSGTYGLNLTFYSVEFSYIGGKRIVNNLERCLPYHKPDTREYVKSMVMGSIMTRAYIFLKLFSILSP